MTLKDLLEQTGIRVLLKSYQIPMYDSIAMVMRPEWGELWVEEHDAEAARSIVHDFLARAEEGRTPQP